MALERVGSGAGAAALRRTAEVVVAALLPRRLPAGAARSLVAPVLVAVASVAAAAALGLMVAIELAVAAWGSGVVAALVLLAALLAPTARLSLAAPPPIALVLTRCAPLLRALDLGGAALARHWAAAAAVPVILPTALLVVATALVLGAHREVGAALVVVLAGAVGVLPAAWLARRGGRRVARGAGAASPIAMAARRFVAVGALAGAAVASAPLALGTPPTAAAGAGLAAAIWVAGDALAVDLRPWLRLQVSLVDCGASRARVVGRVAAVGAVGAAALGVAVGTAAGAVAGAEAGAPIGAAAAGTAAAALAVLALEPDARAALARCLAFAAAIVPTVAALVVGAAAGWIVAAAITVAAVGVVALVRRLS